MARTLPIITLLFFCFTAMAMEDYEQQSAQAKLEHIRNFMKESSYEQLPDITGPGFLGIFDVLSSRFLAKAFTNNGDVMEPDREKRVHTFGTVIEIAFIVNPEATMKFSGLFASGAQFGLLRLSLAEPPEGNNYKPGFAIKLFRTNAPSANIFAMPSLDGIESTNLLQEDFVTALLQPKLTPKGIIVGSRFKKAVTKHLNMPRGNILALSHTETARVDEDGKEYSEVIAPYSLIFRPTAPAQLLLKDGAMDFRVALQGKGEGLKLFDVYAVTSESDKSAHHIGSITGTSAFATSAYSDQALYFKHPRPHEIK